MPDTAAGSNEKNEGTTLSHQGDELLFLREIEGAQVWLRTVPGGQEIWLENKGWAGLLGLALAKPEERRVGHLSNGREFVVVFHSEHVDRLIYELVDLLIDMRVQHPTMMQLPLQLTEEEVLEWKERMGD